MRKSCVPILVGIAVALVFLSGLYISLSFSQVMGSPRAPPRSSQFVPSSPELSSTQISASTNQTCTLTPPLIEVEGTPQQIEGPYFVDGMPNRSDIRSDPLDGSVQLGIPLHLALHVYGVDDNDRDSVSSCVPISTHT
jgi:hypothetical protein